MKKRLFFLIGILLIATAAFAANAVVYTSSVTSPYTGLITMTTTTTATSAGQGTVGMTPYYVSVPMGNISCTKVISGVTPTTQTLLLEGTLDSGATWTTVGSSTTVGNDRIDVTGKLVTGIRINQSILTKASGTITNTVKCILKQ
jgi:hypothetical protein